MLLRARWRLPRNLRQLAAHAAPTKALKRHSSSRQYRCHHYHQQQHRCVHVQAMSLRLQHTGTATGSSGSSSQVPPPLHPPRQQQFSTKHSTSSSSSSSKGKAPTASPTPPSATTSDAQHAQVLLDAMVVHLSVSSQYQVVALLRKFHDQVPLDDKQLYVKRCCSSPIHKRLHTHMPLFLLLWRPQPSRAHQASQALQARLAIVRTTPALCPQWWHTPRGSVARRPAPPT